MAGGIKDELKAYDTFVKKVEENINKSIKPAAADNLTSSRKAEAAYAALQREYAALESTWSKLWRYVNDKDGSDNKEIKKQLAKFFQGTGNSKKLAESIYDNLVFKTDAVRRDFFKTFKTRPQIVNEFAGITRQRKAVSMAANKAIDLYNNTSIVGHAVFKARYYISGSLVNHSSMSGTDNALKRKLARAEEILNDPASGVSAKDRAKYQKRIDDVRSKHEAYMTRCRDLGSESDVIESSSGSIDFNDDWAAISKNLTERYKITLKKIAPIRDADSHRVWRKCFLLRKAMPRISPSLPPGSLTPAEVTPQLSPEEIAREEWIAATAGFRFEAPLLHRGLDGFKSYLEQDHFEDFVDLDSDGTVLPVFNSWIQPITRAIAPLKAAIDSLDAAYKAEDLDAFSQAREALGGQIAAFDKGCTSSIAGFKATRIPFEDPREMQQNINNIADRLDNYHATLLAELKSI